MNELFVKMKEANPELKDKLNSDIAMASFIWVDDGKNDLKATILKNTQTGEISKIKTK